MPLTPKKQRTSQKQAKLLASSGLIVGVGVLLVFAFVLLSSLDSKTGKSTTNEGTPVADVTPYNEETFKEAFLANCTIQAKANLSESAADVYCQCVLNRGIAIHGVKRFIEMNQEIAETYDLSKMKDLINECVAKATT